MHKGKSIKKQSGVDNADWPAKKPDCIQSQLDFELSLTKSTSVCNLSEASMKRSKMLWKAFSEELQQHINAHGFWDDMFNNKSIMRVYLSRSPLMLQPF